MQGVQAVRWLARNRSSKSGWMLASGSYRETGRYKLGQQIEGMARGLTTIAGDGHQQYWRNRCRSPWALEVAEFAARPDP